MKRILVTSRLVLREMGLDDLDFLAALLADPEVMRFFPKRYSREEAAAWIGLQQRRYVTDGFGYWLAVEKSTQKPIGQAGVLAQKVNGQSEMGLGYIIHRPFWRQGFATEAAAACRDYVFYTRDAPRTITLIRPENLASLGVARKIGMRLEGQTHYAGFIHLIFSAARPEPAKEEAGDLAKGNRPATGHGAGGDPSASSRATT